MLRLGDDVSAGTVRGETSVVTSVIAPPTDVTPVVINGHVLAKDVHAAPSNPRVQATYHRVVALVVIPRAHSILRLAQSEQAAEPSSTGFL